MKIEIVERVEIVPSQALLDQISSLQAELVANTSATQSAEALINGFSAQLQAAIAGAQDDASAVAAIKDVVSHFQANDTALARAVAANTPAGPDTPVPPVVAPPATPPTPAPTPSTSGTSATGTSTPTG